jgi:hypothetical protein
MKRVLILSLVAGLHLPSLMLAQGPLAPPGAPAPTMKTLQQIEPRTEINATNTPGDADSVYKITQPGSYYLTGNATGASAKMGIEIAVAAGGASVTIDLGGFELVGVAGSLDGISVTVAGSRNITVRNGTVRGFGGDGINLNSSQNNQLTDLRVQSNGGKGINAGSNSRIDGCTAQSNVVGIATGSGCTVNQCTALSNTGTGITAFNSTLAHCSAFSNGQFGINASSGTTVTDCAAGWNTSTGIFADGCTVTRCTSRGNGGDGITNSHGSILDCTVNENTGNGINGGLSTPVRGCTAYLNSADGIHATVASIVTDCTATSNGGDGIDAGQFNITVHACITDANTGHGIRVVHLPDHRQPVLR